MEQKNNEEECYPPIQLVRQESKVVDVRFDLEEDMLEDLMAHFVGVCRWGDYDGPDEMNDSELAQLGDLGKRTKKILEEGSCSNFTGESEIRYVWENPDSLDKLDTEFVFIRKIPGGEMHLTEMTARISLGSKKGSISYLYRKGFANIVNNSNLMVFRKDNDE